MENQGQNQESNDLERDKQGKEENVGSQQYSQNEPERDENNQEDTGIGGSDIRGEDSYEEEDGRYSLDEPITRNVGDGSDDLNEPETDEELDQRGESQS